MSITGGKKIERQFAPNNNKIVTPQNTRWDIVNLHKQILAMKDLVTRNRKIINLDFYLNKHLFSYNKKIIGIVVISNETEDDIRNFKNITNHVSVFDEVVYVNSGNSKIISNIKKYNKICLDMFGTHIIFLKIFDTSTSEIKNFINMFLSYDLDLLVSSQDYIPSERISPTNENTNLMFKNCVLKSRQADFIDDSKMIGLKQPVYNKIFNPHHRLYYKKNNMCDVFILNSIDEQGMYIPLKETLMEDLSE